jgi:hypothetical protein
MSKTHSRHSESGWRARRSRSQPSALATHKECDAVARENLPILLGVVAKRAALGPGRHDDRRWRRRLQVAAGKQEGSNQEKENWQHNHRKITPRNSREPVPKVERRIRF